MNPKEDREAKGRQLLSLADKKANSFNGLFGTLVGKSSAVEEAIDLYIKGANQLKMAHQWNDAGNAFCSAARLQRRCGERHNSALNYVCASNCFVKSDPQKAVDCLLDAIFFYQDLGRLGACAKHYVTVADIYHTHLHQTDKAIEFYEMAANHFKAENSIASANKCLMNVANHLALQQNYEKAIAIYEEIAKHCIESTLLKYCATNHFARAALCHLAVDLLNGELALKRYEEWFPAFGDSRECKLITDLIAKIEDHDSEGFRQSIRVYDNISRLDNWFVTVLLTISKKYLTDDSDPDVK